MRLAPRWRKLLGDLRQSRGRLAMMVAALAVGVLATTTILSAYAILTREMSRNYLGTRPASALIDIDRVDPALLATVRAQPGVADAEAAASVLARVETGPGSWLPILLFVVPDFDAQRMNRFRPEAGAWPPPDATMLLERSALSLIAGARIGSRARIQSANGDSIDLAISGLVHDPGLAPAWQEQTVYAYVTPATAARLGTRGARQILKVGVGEAAATEATVTRLALWLRRNGHDIDEIRIPPPGKHPHQTQMNAILAMLLVFSAMALLLSGVLSATMIDAMLAGQLRQIGIMKAIGARTRQIGTLYLLLVGALAAGALLLGVPAGVALGRALARVVAELLNFTLVDQALPPWVWLTELAAGLLVPLLATLVPIRRASRITVREAIGDVALSRTPFGAQRFDALLGKLRGIDRPLLLAIRNTFRRRGRLLLTLGMLAAAGAMFMASLNVKAGWERNLADAAADRRFDLELRLAAGADERSLLALVGAVPGVKRVESWGVAAAARDQPDGLQLAHTYPDGGHGSFSLRAAPEDSRFAALRVLAGRWLRADDVDAAVLNHTALSLYPDAQVGGTVRLRVHGRLAVYRVVGIVREIITPATVYVSPAGFEQVAAAAGTTNALRVATSARDATERDAITAAIRAALVQAHVPVRLDISESRLDGALSGHVLILIVVLILMSLLMAVVGTLGLMSAMGTSVIERTREFGIMRTIGARSATVIGSVVGEGLFIGLLSMAGAFALSLPLSLGVGRLVGMLAFRLPLPLTVSPLAAAIWLLIIVAGSALASAFPAMRAAQLTIRQTLAHT